MAVFEDIEEARAVYAETMNRAHRLWDEGNPDKAAGLFQKAIELLAIVDHGWARRAERKALRLRNETLASAEALA